MANPEGIDNGNPTNQIPEPTDDQVAKDQARRLHRSAPDLYRNPDARDVVDHHEEQRTREAKEAEERERLLADHVAREKAKEGKDGEKEKDDDQEEKKDVQPREGGYELEIPAEVPQQFFEQTEANIQQASMIAAELGVPQDEAQMLVDHAVALGVSDQSGVSLEDRDACLSVLNRRYGSDESKQIVEQAQRAVIRLGRKAADFLDSTGLGNSPAVLAALAAMERGDFRLSPEKAQQELDKITKGDARSAYRSADHAGHKSAVDRVNLLYRILAKGEAKAAAQPKPTPMKSGTQNEMEALDAEIAAAIKEPSYRKGDKATLARVRELYARRYPDNQ